jgi:ABC-type sugar transport system substrate-binding protein
MAAAVVFIASGCGSSSSSSSSSSTSSSSASGEALKAKAATMLTKFETAPTHWPAPTEPFKPGKGTAAAIACTFAAPVCAVQAKNAVEAFKALGWTTRPAVDGKGEPSVQAAFLEKAVQEKLTAVLLVSIDLDTIKSAVERATKAGLLIGCTMCVASKEYTSTGKVFDGTTNFTTQGEMDAWAAMARSGSDTKAVQTLDKAFLPLPLRTSGFEKTLKAECSTCSVETIPFATADVAKPGPPEVTATLAKDPPGSINTFVAHYDGAGTLAAKTIAQVGRKEILVYGYDGSEEGITALATQKPPYGATASEPYTYAEWAVVDQLGRANLKKPEWPGLNELPSQLITPKNAHEFLNPYHDPVPSGDWQKETFEKNWEKG